MKKNPTSSYTWEDQPLPLKAVTVVAKAILPDVLVGTHTGDNGLDKALGITIKIGELACLGLALPFPAVGLIGYFGFRAANLSRERDSSLIKGRTS